MQNEKNGIASEWIQIVRLYKKNKFVIVNLGVDNASLEQIQIIIKKKY